MSSRTLTCVPCRARQSLRVSGMDALREPSWRPRAETARSRSGTLQSRPALRHTRTTTRWASPARPSQLFCAELRGLRSSQAAPAVALICAGRALNPYRVVREWRLDEVGLSRPSTSNERVLMLGEICWSGRGCLASGCLECCLPSHRAICCLLLPRSCHPALGCHNRQVPEVPARPRGQRE